jgi:putative NADPH-quinone reductase
MMGMTQAPRRILLIQGHPDGLQPHYLHALAQAYAEGAREAGHAVREVDVSRLDVPLLRSAEAWKHGPVPPSLLPVQADVLWAEHLVLLFPLWLGDMPALLKAFLEQLARPGFAFKPGADGNPFAAKALGGRSARVVVTMGMPALVYRYLYRAHSVKSLERNILGFVGIAPVNETLIGSVEAADGAARRRWLDKLRALGRGAA